MIGSFFAFCPLSYLVLHRVGGRREQLLTESKRHRLAQQLQGLHHPRLRHQAAAVPLGRKPRQALRFPALLPAASHHFGVPTMPLSRNARFVASVFMGHLEYELSIASASGMHRRRLPAGICAWGEQLCQV
jgi:hypothetical protein